MPRPAAADRGPVGVGRLPRLRRVRGRSIPTRRRSTPISELYAPSPFRLRVVPPTATTVFRSAGQATPNPESPAETVIATPGPGCTRPGRAVVAVRAVAVGDDLGAAVGRGVHGRLEVVEAVVLASKSSMRQFWQIARAISTSRAISVAQPAVARRQRRRPSPARFITSRQLPAVPSVHWWYVEMPNVSLVVLEVGCRCSGSCTRRRSRSCGLPTTVSAGCTPCGTAPASCPTATFGFTIGVPALSVFTHAMHDA